MRVDVGSIALVAGVAAAASALLTLLALRYSHWRRMLDQPGRRRMHAQATPRGGGVAIVAVTAAAGAIFLPAPLGPAFVACLLLVAGIGWIDDHRPLSARVRLAVHLLASLVFVATLWPPLHIDAPLEAAIFLVAVLGLTASINFWNFMDGSNGMVASQTVWVAAALAGAFALLAAPAWLLCATALAAASLAFLPFNAPRARIFLGDVGSGGLGFACAALWLVAFELDRGAFWWLVLIPAVLLVDAGLTLLHRFASGRRWYTAHREHLYQWWIRSGSSHGRVASAYFGWNVGVLLPAILAALHWPRAAPWIACAAVAATAAAWVFGKRAARRRVRRSR